MWEETGSTESHSPPRHNQATAKLAFQVHQGLGASFAQSLASSRPWTACLQQGREAQENGNSSSAWIPLPASSYCPAASSAWEEWCSTSSPSPSPHLATAVPLKPRLQLFPGDRAGLTSQTQVNSVQQPRTGAGESKPPPRAGTAQAWQSSLLFPLTTCEPQHRCWKPAH